MAPKKATTRKSTGSIPAAKPLHARKSQGIASTSRTARKAAPPVQNDSDEENVVRSAPGSSRKRAAPADDTESEEESDDVDASLVQQPTSPKKKSKTVVAEPAAKPASKTKKAAPASAPASEEEDSEEEEDDSDDGNETMAVVAANSQTGATKTSKSSKNTKRKSTTVSTEEAESSDDEDLVSSGSGRGANGYTWEIVDIRLKPEDIGSKLTYHPDLKVKLERDGKQKRYFFQRHQRIFVLPDPSWLPPQSREVDLIDLPDDQWWSATILDCCRVDQSDQGPGLQPLGLLRVAWDYSPDDALNLIGKNIHKSFEKRLTDYRFDEDERIRSDHVDLISIDSFAGFADGIVSHIDIKGLEIPDAERLRPLAQRKKVSRAVNVTGFERKATALKKAKAAARRDKAYKSSSQTKSKKPTSSSEVSKKRKAEPAPVEKKSSKKSRKSRD